MNTDLPASEPDSVEPSTAPHFAASDAFVAEVQGRQMALQQLIRSKIQQNVRREAEQGNWLIRAARKSLPVSLVTLTLAPLVPINAPAMTVAAIGIASNLGANAVAGWLDKAFQKWANIPDEDEQRLDALEQLLLEQLETDEQLLKGIVDLLHQTRVCHVAIEGLEQRQDQQFRELINDIKRLSAKIDQLVVQKDDGSWFEQLKEFVIPKTGDAVLIRRSRSQAIPDTASESAVQKQPGKSPVRVSHRRSAVPPQQISKNKASQRQGTGS